MSLLFILFYYVNWKLNGQGALISGRISCILGITTLNGPWLLRPAPSAKRGARNEKREFMKLYIIGSHLQWDKHESGTSPDKIQSTIMSNNMSIISILVTGNSHVTKIHEYSCNRNSDPCNRNTETINAYIQMNLCNSDIKT